MSLNIISLILMPALSAFLVLSLTPFYKYHLKHISAHMLILWLLFAAVCLNLISTLLLHALRAMTDACPWLHDIFLVLKAPYKVVESSLDYSISMEASNDIGAFCFVVAVFIVGLNYGYRKLMPIRYKAFEESRKVEAAKSNRTENPIDNLLEASLNLFIPVMVTLKNNKVYIGWVCEYDLLSSYEDKISVSLFLSASGHRKSDNLEFVLDNDYRVIIEDLIGGQDVSDIELLDWGLSIKLDEIVSVTPWVLSVYEEAATYSFGKATTKSTSAKKKKSANNKLVDGKAT